MAGESTVSNSVVSCTCISNGLLFSKRALQFDSPHDVMNILPSIPVSDFSDISNFISDIDYNNTNSAATPMDDSTTPTITENTINKFVVTFQHTTTTPPVQDYFSNEIRQSNNEQTIYSDDVLAVR